MKSKKAQIPSTIVWMSASFIIFLILILFISASLFLSLRKNEVIFEISEETDFKSVKTLQFILKKQTDGREIKALLKEWTENPKKNKMIKSQIEDSVKEFLLDSEECWIFYADYGLEKFLKKKCHRPVKTVT